MKNKIKMTALKGGKAVNVTDNKIKQNLGGKSMIKKNSTIGFTNRDFLLQIGDTLYASERGEESPIEDNWNYVLRDAQNLFSETWMLNGLLMSYAGECLKIGGRSDVTLNDVREEYNRIHKEVGRFEPVIKDEWTIDKKIAVYISAIVANNKANSEVLKYCVWLKNEKPDDFIDSLRLYGRASF